MALTWGVVSEEFPEEVGPLRPEGTGREGPGVEGGKDGGGEGEGELAQGGMRGRKPRGAQTPESGTSCGALPGSRTRHSRPGPQGSGTRRLSGVVEHCGVETAGQPVAVRATPCASLKPRLRPASVLGHRTAPARPS